VEQAPGNVKAPLDAGGVRKEVPVQVWFQLEELRHRRNNRLGIQILQPGKKGQILHPGETAVKAPFIAGDKAQVAFHLQRPTHGIVALHENPPLGGNEEGGNELEEGGFAGAVGTHNAKVLPGPQLQVHFPQSPTPGKVAAGEESAEFDVGKIFAEVAYRHRRSRCQKLPLGYAMVGEGL
jgi:hypothetical protein